MEESLISNRKQSRHTDLGRRISTSSARAMKKMMKKTFGTTHVMVLTLRKKFTTKKHYESRTCGARFPADLGSLYAAAESLLV